LPALHTSVVNEMESRRMQAQQWAQSPLRSEKGYAQSLISEVNELGVLKAQMDSILNPDEVDAAIKRLTSN